MKLMSLCIDIVKQYQRSPVSCFYSRGNFLKWRNNFLIRRKLAGKQEANWTLLLFLLVLSYSYQNKKFSNKLARRLLNTHLRHKPKKLSKEATVEKYFQNFVITGVITLFGAGAVFAAPADDPGMKAREMNQQKRIDQGVKSGQLTPGGAGKPETEQAKIKQDEAKMKSDSKVTKKKSAKSHKKQKKASKQVHKKKATKKKVNAKEKES
jgi:hypothetical protein